MRRETNPSFLFGKIFGILGLCFAAVGLLCFFIGARISGEAAVALWNLWLVFLPMGGVFLLGGVIGFTVARRRKRKEERLMRDGLCFPGEIVRIYENPYLRANYRRPFVVECVYRDGDGQKCLVKSGNIWRDSLFLRETAPTAKVWVSQDNPRDYFVEVSFASDRADADIRYDRDYR